MKQPDIASIQNLKVTALVSVGLHPESKRARRAEQDGRAVELGLRLSPQLEVVHAGNPENEALRTYAGMGLSHMRILKQSDQDDAVPALCNYLSSETPDILLTGIRAESGESSGMTPFLIAQKLGWPMVCGIADIVSIDKGVAKVLQALPRGQRRSISVPLPFVATVDMAAQAPRQSAFGPARRANLDEKSIDAIPDAERCSWEELPARKRPKRMKVVKAKNAADRFKAAAAKSSGGGGKVLRDKPVAEMAQEVFDMLLEEGVIR